MKGKGSVRLVFEAGVEEDVQTPKVTEVKKNVEDFIQKPEVQIGWRILKGIFKRMVEKEER